VLHGPPTLCWAAQVLVFWLQTMPFARLQRYAVVGGAAVLDEPKVVVTPPLTSPMQGASPAAPTEVCTHVCVEPPPEVDW
jgi:hypothetical protein